MTSITSCVCPSPASQPPVVSGPVPCSSHNAMWEKNHLLLFKASLEWLTDGSVNGAKEGMLKLGY